MAANVSAITAVRVRLSAGQGQFSGGQGVVVLGTAVGVLVGGTTGPQAAKNNIAVKTTIRRKAR
jgi:hypothetical protein